MKKKNKILYVEDDMNLSFVTKDNLELRDYEVFLYKNGDLALKSFKKGKFDICILDIMLPIMDGFTLAKEIRKKDKEIPIIFLSAKSTLDDKIFGLQIGADDYITKPFSIQELVLKIEIFLKRSKILSKKEDEKKEFKIGKYIFQEKDFFLIYENKIKKLTFRENELLKFFIKNKNKILKREDILLEVWKDDNYFVGRSLDVFISRLRKYLRKDKNIKIANIHGIGFRMEF